MHFAVSCSHKGAKWITSVTVYGIRYTACRTYDKQCSAIIKEIINDTCEGYYSRVGS